MIIRLLYYCLRSIIQLHKPVITFWKMKFLKCPCHGPACFQQHLTGLHNVKILLKMVYAIHEFSSFPSRPTQDSNEHQVECLSP